MFTSSLVCAATFPFAGEEDGNLSARTWILIIIGERVGNESKAKVSLGLRHAAVKWMNGLVNQAVLR